MSDVEPVAPDSLQQESDGREPTSEKDAKHLEREEANAAQAKSGESQVTEAPPTEEEDQATQEQVIEESEANQLQALRAELEQAQSQASEYLEGWQRARAEFANFKKRMEADREELRRTSNETLLLKLLPVVDDFERAFQTLPEELADVPWVDGIRMISRKLQAVLESEKVTPIEAAGQPFDPLWHEAIMQEETTEYPDEHVMEEMQRGYRLGERVLRPSMVKVASNANRSDNDVEDESDNEMESE